ncbi:MAG: DUF389 domain-containing protein [Vicingaceae bacterium]
MDPIRKSIALIKGFLISELSIKGGTDPEATIAGIKRDITFRGPAAWILAFSILIASIGLNVNSVAVIIGAMLISPLMGPILGVGLSLAINDWATLNKSLRNFAIAIVLSVLTSALYFSITPLDFEQSELLSRTRPTILDVLVAFFGGFAGIIAGSRKEKSNVVPGVAIATALMPPLCTAGYGLANLNWSYFLGATYLFFINSVFIALSTYLVVRYLKFPKIDQMEVNKARKYRIGLIAFLVVTIIPSIWIFYRVIQETRYVINAERFIAEQCFFDGSELISKKITYNDSASVIDLYYIGSKVDEDKELFMRDRLTDYRISGNERFPMTKKTKVIIHQERDEGERIQEGFSTLNKELKMSILEDIYTKNQTTIQDKDLKIQLLEDELTRVRTMGIIPMTQLQAEMTFHFKDIQKFSFANIIEVTSVNDTLRTDTIPSILVNFKPKTSRREKSVELKNISEWLSIRLDKDTVQVLEY